jgi:NADPH:quinone reductase
VRTIFNRLAGWLATGAIRPRIAARLPLDRVAEAFAIVADRSRIGHVVVEPPGSPERSCHGNWKRSESGVG